MTGKEGSGVDAHIIPRAFYRLEGDQPPGLKVLSSTLGTYPRRSQIGEYDNLIVTEHGERLFSPYDDYAKELLIDGREAFHELRHENRIVGFGVDGYDYARLKLFILSVLWRASVSSRAFFNKINLGPHEEEFRAAIVAGDPGHYLWYPVCLATWHDQQLHGSILDPHRTRFFDINFCQIYLENYIAYVKVDKRPGPKQFESIYLKPDAQLHVVARALRESQEYEIMKNVVQLHARS